MRAKFLKYLGFYTPIQNSNVMLKIAMTGTSGAGKTTLVKYIAEKFNIPHLSGSASDVLSESSKNIMQNLFNDEGDGHLNVIQKSADNYGYGKTFQDLLRMDREALISNNDRFITDRSPVDNITYLVNQVGFHPECSNLVIWTFFQQCLRTFCKLTHVIYIKPVQPNNQVEDNGSRIANGWYQKAIDAQFNYWLNELVKSAGKFGPKVLIIDFWDLDRRKALVSDFINSTGQFGQATMFSTIEDEIAHTNDVRNPSAYDDLKAQEYQKLVQGNFDDPIKYPYDSSR